jgi:hypothetical protein
MKCVVLPRTNYTSTTIAAIATIRRTYYYGTPARAHHTIVQCSTESKPLSVTITGLRWTMLGHTLRLPEDTPGNKAIKQYYQRKVEQTDRPRKSTNRGRLQ